MNKDQILATLAKGNTLKTALHALDVSKLPTQLQAFFSDLKTKLDAALSQMPPTEQVPAAMDAGNMLSWAVNRVCSMQEMLDSVVAQCAGLATTFQTHSAEQLTQLLPGKIDEAVTQRLSAGALVTKADHEKAVNAAASSAREEGIAEGLRRAQLHSARKEKLTTLKLAAPETILALDDAAFDAKVTLATGRLAEAAKLQVHGKPFDYAFDFFAEQAAWDRELSIAATACKAVTTAATQRHSRTGGPLPNPAEGGGGTPADKWENVSVG